MTAPAIGRLGAPPGGPSVRVRVWLLGALVLVLFAILTAQLVRLQIINPDQYAARAAINRVRTLDISPQRGLIYARDGSPLVENIPRYSVTLVAGDIPDADVPRVAAALAPLFDLRGWEIEELILARKRSIDPFLPIVIDDEPAAGVVLDLQTRESELPGLVIETRGERRYAHGELLGHILGYVGPIDPARYPDLAGLRYQISDRIGQTGVEAVYESELRGEPGWRQVEVDATGRVLKTIEEQAPAPGNSITLSIDLPLQERVRRIVADAMGASNYGAAALIDVRTGELLALVSEPAYDVNIFSDGLTDAEWRAILEDPGQPLRNHAVSDQFAPGSVFKVVTGLAALAEGVVDEDTRIYSSRELVVGDETNPDRTYVFTDTVEGEFDFRSAIAQSSNTYFFYAAGGAPFRHPDAPPREPAVQARLDALVERGVIAGDAPFNGVGPDALGRWAREFGLDSATGVDLLAEAGGLIPTRQEKLRAFGVPWLDGDTYNFGIGQGSTAVTPLQMAVATAAIANGGDVLRPQVVREVRNAEGRLVRPFQPAVARRMDVDPAHLKLIREGMALSVLAGTSGLAQDALPGMMLAGKTGTAEFGLADPIPGSGEDPRPLTHGWFIGFAPFEDPEVAVAVFVEFGAGFIVAEAGGRILAAWAEHAGELARAVPPPRGRITATPDEDARVLREILERSR